MLAGMTPSTTIQIGSVSRSRRSARRISAPVPTNELMARWPSPTRVAVAGVVPQEQLLEGRRLADHAAHAVPGEQSQGLVEGVGVDVEVDPRALDVEVVDERRIEP